MTESKELRAARMLYMAKLTNPVARSIPPSMHYTAGYKDGSAILSDVAKTCAEAERRLTAVETRYEVLHAAFSELIASLKECSDPWGFAVRQCEPEDYEKAVRVLEDLKCN